MLTGFLPHVFYLALNDWLIFKGDLIGFFEFHIVHCLQFALINYYV